MLACILAFGQKKLPGGCVGGVGCMYRWGGGAVVRALEGPSENISSTIFFIALFD